MPTVHAYAATEVGGRLRPYEYELPERLRHDEVEIDIYHCGICYSDVSVLEDEWGVSQYPLVPGHEVVGTIRAVGEHVTHVQVGQWVGIGWFSRSCLVCDHCMGGDHNLCSTAEGIVVGRPGGFADKVRVQAHECNPSSAPAMPPVAGGNPGRLRLIPGRGSGIRAGCETR